MATRKPIVLVDGDLQQLTTTDYLELGASKFIYKTGTNAIVGGVLTGNTRGSYALDVQSQRSNASKVAASDYSIAIGLSNQIASAGTHCLALGNFTYTGTHKGQIAIGYNVYSYGGLYNLSLGNIAFSTARYATSIGQGVYATAEKTIAIGYNVTASASNSIALGGMVNVNSSYGIGIGSSTTVSEANGIAIGKSSSIASGATNSIAIGNSATVVAAATNSIAIGNGAAPVDSDNIIIGNNITITPYSGVSYASVIIGNNSYSSGYKNVSIGYKAGHPTPYLGTGYATAIGYKAKADDTGVAIGSLADTSGNLGGIAIGVVTTCSSYYGVVIGSSRANIVDESTVLNAPILPELILSNARIYRNSGSPAILCLYVNAKFVTTNTLTLPSGCKFFVDEIGVIVEDYASISAQPYLEFGITGDTNKFATNAQTTGLTAEGERERITVSDIDTGVTSLVCKTNTAAVGTTMILRVYFKGIFVTDYTP